MLKTAELQTYLWQYIKLICDMCDTPHFKISEIALKGQMMCFKNVQLGYTSNCDNN